MFPAVDIEQRLALSCADRIEQIISDNPRCDRETSYRVDLLLVTRERLRAER